MSMFEGRAAMKRAFVLLGGPLIIAGCGQQAASQQSTAVNETNAAAPSANAVVAAGEGSGHSIVDSAGATVGFVTGMLDAQGLKLDINIYRLPRGKHGMHLHEVGKCDPPDFVSAVAHWNPLNKHHGHGNPQGPHEGDLGNIDVGADGRVHVTRMIPVPGAGQRRLADLSTTGLSLVIHKNADDEKTDPSGNSGVPIACGLVVPG
jgi:Cu-Zn family superoxide dismutase